ncbi:MULTISPECIES: hypothetical protein [unclassified Streptomyces]|uniref:hypothetical protein n=1 Tax=unclassified Streptomyces TaxID=2593676 RepID=UPI001BE5C283|nr:MULTISPECIES: hypothetical protein [unclassified Streptomyces]MBT2408515.1 hypothetical protein [Streptomyces sp. ISL-21]MBT2459682.1 hypothetical protein [Streptomyces sp. ISL-86]MBT2611952.1 hypothetical protein [Streptomyces sp. ISL-87]
MTGRGFTALTLRAACLIAGAVPIACLILLLVPQQASACTVSLGYRPSLKVNFNDPHFISSRACANGTSLAGSTIVALLAVTALAAAGTRAFKRGAALTVSSSSPGQDTGPGQALTDYLQAAGTAPPAPGPGQSQAGDHGAHP